MPNQHIDSSSLSHHAKNRKAYQGSLQVSSTSRYGVRALALPQYMGAARYLSLKRGKSCERSSLLLFCLPFLSCICFCLLPASFRRSEGEKRNFLTFPFSPALFSTADVKKGI